jgi:hypothetical protein
MVHKETDQRDVPVKNYPHAAALFLFVIEPSRSGNLPKLAADRAHCTLAPEIRWQVTNCGYSNTAVKLLRLQFRCLGVRRFAAWCFKNYWLTEAGWALSLACCHSATPRSSAPLFVVE